MGTPAAVENLRSTPFPTRTHGCNLLISAHGSTAAATGLVLLGFKPQSYLKPSHFIQPGIFAYPEEKYVGGSAKLFRALLEKCAERRVMAVCRLVARTNMAPRLVALLPQVRMPSGMLVSR